MRRKRMLVVFSSILCLAACNQEEEALPVAGQTVKVEEVEQEKVEELKFQTPFTGEAAAQELTNRPVLVTINNHPAARPQSGIASADIVYEMLAEGNVTRLLALYQSEMPTVIGPVRSARAYFVDLAKGLDAFYIAHGNSPEAKEMLTSESVDNINGMNYDGTLFKRSTERVAPHNSYFPTENLEIAAEKVGASLLYQKKVLYSFYEPDETIKLGVHANEIQVTYSNEVAFNSSYHYDEAAKAYKRSSNKAITTDYLTNEPVQLSNVLFFEMSHEVIDDEGRREIDISSGGKAYIAQQGTLREVRWKNKKGLLVAVEDNGAEVALVPGKSWVHFIPTTPGLATTVTYSD